MSSLIEKVVKTGLCARCGACVAICPFGVLEMGENGPELVRECLRCGNCYLVCPRYRMDVSRVEELSLGRARRPDEEFGVVRSILLARSKDPEVLAVCQDGGVVSTLVRHLLADGPALAVLSGLSEEEPWLPEAKIVVSPREVLRCAGSRYTYTPNMLLHLGAAALLAFSRGLRTVFVGLPCQVQAARGIQLLPAPEVGWAEAIGPIIGLFCMETFDRRGLLEGVLRGRLGLEPKEVVKMNIKKGRLYFYTAGGEAKSVRVRELSDIVREGCSACTDFSSELADISVGSLGLEGWNVVILRSELGEEAFRGAVEAGLLETRPLEEEPKVLEVLRRLVALKRARAPGSHREGM